MSAPVIAQIGLSCDQRQAECWGLVSWIGFCFCFLYFGLYYLLKQIFGSPLPAPIIEFPDLGTFHPFRQIVFWIAEHVFRYQ